jgi:hypothetical protein
MIDEGRHAEHADHGRLTDLLSRVHAARERLERAREEKGRPEQQLLRQELLTALEAYAAAIGDSGAPLPYRLRTEIDLYKGLRGRG